MSTQQLLELVFVLLMAFQLKHFVGDYLLQVPFPYMMGKFKPSGWVGPLAAHCGVHAVLTLLIALCFSGTKNFWLTVFWVAIFDFLVHFAIDRIKASPFYLGRYSIQQKQFWIALGWDQWMHHLTHYAIIYVILQTYPGV